MRWSVNRVFSCLLTATVSVALTLIAEVRLRAPKTFAGDASQVTSAAFRDGGYQAKLDVNNGRKPHLSSGRWSSNEDRLSYIAGHQQTYAQSLSSSVGKVAEPAELTGKRDGIIDGTRDRGSLQKFHLTQKANYQTAGGCLSDGNRSQETYSTLYRNAYANGYQEGYYRKSGQPK